MHRLLKLYQTLGMPLNYYPNLIEIMKSNPCEYLQSDRFLYGVSAGEGRLGHELICCQSGDVRIDAPVWFGGLDSVVRIMVVGMEPRATNDGFNLARHGRYVFASPFGVDRWSRCSSIRYKPQNKYFSCFGEWLLDSDVGMFFTDIVKEYDVVDVGDKARNDRCARMSFVERCDIWRDFLESEIDVIRPDAVVFLGEDSYRLGEKLLGEREFEVVKIRHPANGGAKVAKEQFNVLVRGLLKSYAARVCR